MFHKSPGIAKMLLQISCDLFISILCAVMSDDAKKFIKPFGLSEKTSYSEYAVLSFHILYSSKYLI